MAGGAATLVAAPLVIRLPSTAASGVHLRRLRRSGDFSQWYTYGGDRPTVAGEVVEPPSPDEGSAYSPSARGAHCLDVTEDGPL
jgi:hypothetical protein